MKTHELKGAHTLKTRRVRVLIPKNYETDTEYVLTLWCISMMEKCSL